MSALVKPAPSAEVKTIPATMEAMEIKEAALDLLFELTCLYVNCDTNTYDAKE